MTIKRLWLLAAVLAWSLAAAETDEFRWQGRIAAGKAIEIKGVNGAVRAQAVAGDQVEVTAVKTGRRSDPKLVKIDVVEHADGVTICAVYPNADSDRPNECKPGSGGRSSTRHNDVTVDFAVRVPAGVRFLGRTVNGNIEAASLKSEVQAHTVNGSLRISTSGHAAAEAVNGSIHASLGSASWTGPLEFKTVNGSISIELPDGAGAEVSAQTVNGGIETDFPLTVQGRFGPKKVSGTIGAGGRRLEIKTVNGNPPAQGRRSVESHRVLSLAEARRIALAAQGFDRRRPDRVLTEDIRRVIPQLGLLQIDLVNVLVPALGSSPSRGRTRHRLCRSSYGRCLVTGARRTGCDRGGSKGFWSGTPAMFAG